MSQREGYILAAMLLLVIIVFIAVFAIWQANATDSAVLTQQAINQELLGN